MACTSRSATLLRTRVLNATFGRPDLPRELARPLALPAAMQRDGTPPSPTVALRRRLRKVRPPAYLVLEAMGRHAILQALKALAGVAPFRMPVRFTPVLFLLPSPSPATDGTARRGRCRWRPMMRGIRFFLSQPMQIPVSSELPTAQFVAATTSVEKLARAVSLERRMRDRNTPVVLEAVCASQHALVLCLALARAQQLAFQTGESERLLTCTIQVRQAASCASDVELARRGVPRILRIMVWSADVPECFPQPSPEDVTRLSPVLQ